MTRALALLPPILLAGCLGAGDEAGPTPLANGPDTIAADGSSYGDGARLTGVAVQCISVAQVNSGTSAVRSDRVIDFEGNGRTFRNVLPEACPRLGAERRIAYRTTIGRLCRAETVTVLRSGGGTGATCALGNFQPIAGRPR